MKTMPNLLYHTMSARTCRLAETAQIRPDPVRLLMCWGLLGVGIGAMLRTKNAGALDAVIFTQGMAVSDSLRTLQDVFLRAVLPMLALLFGMLFCGCAACGQPCILALLLSRGIAYGLTAAEVFTAYPARDGIVIAGVLILPFGFCSMLLLCHAALHALRLSNRMTAYLLRGKIPEQCAEEKQRMFAGMPVWLLLSVLAAGMHTLLIWQLNDRLLMP